MIAEIESIKDDLPRLSADMKLHAPNLEKLTKLATEMNSLKEMHGKLELNLKEDTQTLNAVVSSISENHQVLKSNIANLQTRLEALRGG